MPVVEKTATAGSVVNAQNVLPVGNVTTFVNAGIVGIANVLATDAIVAVDKVSTGVS